MKQDKSGQVYFLGLAPTLESIQYLNFMLEIQNKFISNI